MAGSSSDRRFPQLASFGWRILSFAIGAVFVGRVWPSAMLPPAVVSGACVAWALVGWRSARPWTVGLAIALAELLAGVFGGGAHGSAAWLIPVWAVLFSAPQGGPAAKAFGRGIARAWGFLAYRCASLCRAAARAAGGLFGRHPRLVESARVALSAGAGFAAALPYVHDGDVGGDDSRWYVSVVADHLAQWRAGMGPAFVGQSRFAPIGTVMPLRVAPYLQHVTAALDFATGRTLSPYLLLNLAIVLSYVGGGLSAYLCLRAIAPRRRAEAFLLSVLYVWCPGVIGLSYSGELFMSVMTLPYLPLVFAGIVRAFRRPDFWGWGMTACGCAACWLCHSPIGLWATAAAAAAFGVRWLAAPGKIRSELGRAAGAAALFAALCGYVFVSVAVLDPPESPSLYRGILMESVRAGFPGSLLPVSPGAVFLLTDLQLGYSLWIALLAGMVVVCVRRSPEGRTLAGVCLVLVLLVLPVPFLDRALWQAVPQPVIDATNAVPMQRLYAILAAAVATLTAVAFSTAPETGGGRGGIFAALLLATAWSGAQLVPFVRRGFAVAGPKAAAEQALSPENLLQPRYSRALLFEGNRFYSHGFVDFSLEQRILGANLRTYLASDIGAIAPGFDHGPMRVRGTAKAWLLGTSQPGQNRWLDLSPKLTLEPGRHYLLAFDFPNTDYTGVLQLTGRGFYHEYILPSSGEEFAFGVARLNSRVVPLFSGSDRPLEITLTFVNQDPAADLRKYAHFARYELIEYRPEDLPIRLKSLLPYTAEVRSPAPGWLETFRYFTPGWKAFVDGKPATVRRSWNGLVAVPVPAGESEVRLVYSPPAVLLAAYWATWAAWAGWLACCIAIPRLRASASRP